ncbi:VOC family protein [Isoptericola sp. NPDC019693]|uniref:VOC family protein n=1 Tax=Isoptericola sp. NPDC019693 TaxID=3364009 RepID=UPI0037B81E1E
MTLVTFEALCVDAVDAAASGEFWARTLGLRLEMLDGGGAVLRDPSPEPVPGRTVWVNAVPEAKTVKHRVHPDVRALSLDAFPDQPRLTEPGQYHYTTLADPEGGEFCVFTYDEVPDYRLKDVVVDCADYRKVAAFWQDLLGGTLTQDDAMDYAYLDEAAGVPFESFDFVPVPEPKTVKNRWHWDVRLNDGVTLDDLVARGARVLRPQDDQIRWTVMADPEGNEFCAFPPTTLGG